ncbi:MAG: serine/threonine-protein kinase, partial [Maioricimonas sp. JB049]
MPASTRTFANILQRSGLLSPQQLEEAARIAARPLGDRAIAQQLVQRGLLTPFQAEEILAGRYRRLRIANYVLTGLIGVGGMGSVLRARDRERNRDVALKILSERYKHDSGMQARLRLEAKAGMRLDHPNLLKVFDQGQTDDVFGEVDYLVMELFEGIALHELVGFYGPLPSSMACDLISQAAAGLEAMHQVGMVHRDVKPENLLIDRNGQVKIIDYGLAIAHEMSFDDEFSLAMIFGHDCPGTADYMAPEQFTDGLSADARADIYALGCTLFGALCACRPFRAGSRTAFRRAHQESPRPNVADHAESIPPELNAIVRKMMAVDREQRFDSMQEVVEALKPFGKRKPIDFDFEKLTKKRISIARKKE